ncbi:MAG: lytic transglycosylase domain-containing protein [Acidobacteria bacterium]|nr:lytic transglycosylase domain-containing protein [Acidobacteriota bacterium]
MIRRFIMIFFLLPGAQICQAQPDETVILARGYEPLIIEAAMKHRVDPRLLWTVAWLETRFQPQEISPKGAQGMMQFMPATGRRYKLHNPFDPAQSIDAAARYLRDLQELFDNRLDQILAGYNAGEGAVEAFRTGRKLILSNGHVINPREIKSAIPPYRETVNYVTNGVHVFRRLARARYFSGPHLARLRIIETPKEERAALITVDLEDTPGDIVELKKGSIYVVEETPSHSPILPKKSATRSVYSR